MLERRQGSMKRLRCSEWGAGLARDCAPHYDRSDSAPGNDVIKGCKDQLEKRVRWEWRDGV